MDIMDGNAKLLNSTLFNSLNAVCGMLAGVIENETNEITAEQIARLPDWVFVIAVRANWLPEPSGGAYARPKDADHVQLGYWVVHRTYREQFVALLDALKEIEPVNEEYWRRVEKEEASEQREEQEAEEVRLEALHVQEWSESHGVQSPFGASTSNEEPGPMTAEPSVSLPSVVIREDPEQLLRRRKKEKAISWPQMAMMASRELKKQMDADVKAGIVVSKANRKFSVHVIYRMLRRKNAMPEKTRALAAAIGCAPAALSWPETT